MNDKEKDSFNLKKVINITVGLLISFFAIYFFITGIDIHLFSFHIKLDKLDFSKIFEIVKGIDPYYLFLSIFASQIPFFFRALRIRDIIGKDKITIKESLHLTVIGFGMNNVIPARAGEFYKTYLIKKRANMGFISALGVLVVERLYDGFVMSLFFIISVFIVQDRLVEGSAIIKLLPLLKTFAYIGLSGFFLSIIFVLGFRNSKKIPLVSEKISNFIIKEIGMIDSFLIKKNKKELFSIILNSIFVWLGLGLGLYFLLIAFGISESGIAGAFFTEGVIGFSVALPQAPGYVGVFQIGSSTALGSLGTNVTVAQSMAIILWAVQIIPVTIVFFILFIIGKRN